MVWTLLHPKVAVSSLSVSVRGFVHHQLLVPSAFESPRVFSQMGTSQSRYGEAGSWQSIRLVAIHDRLWFNEEKGAILGLNGLIRPYNDAGGNLAVLHSTTRLWCHKRRRFPWLCGKWLVMGVHFNFWKLVHSVPYDVNLDADNHGHEDFLLDPIGLGLLLALKV